MAKRFYIAFLFLSMLGHSQIIIVNKTNLNGFNTSGFMSNVTKYPDRIEAACAPSCAGAVDTTLNLTGYDSLHIVFTSWSGSMYSGSTIAKVNNTPVNISSASTYTVSTINTTSLVITATLSTVSTYYPRTIVIKDLQIIGFPTVTSIKTSSEVNDFVMQKDKLLFNGQLKDQRIIINNILGQTIQNKTLDKTNNINLDAGVYFIRVVDGNRLLYSKKIYSDN